MQMELIEMKCNSELKDKVKKVELLEDWFPEICHMLCS